MAGRRLRPSVSRRFPPLSGSDCLPQLVWKNVQTCNNQNQRPGKFHRTCRDSLYSFMNQVLTYIWNPEMSILQRQEDIAEQPSRQCTAPRLCVNFSLHKIWICYYEYFNCLKHKYCAVAFKAVYDYFNWTIQISQKYQYSNSTNVTIVIAQIWIS